MTDLSGLSMSSQQVPNLLRLATVENHSADRAAAQLSRGPPHDGEYLLFLMMVWHLCSLLEPHCVILDALLAESGRRHWHPWLFWQMPKFSPGVSSALQLFESSLQAQPRHVSVPTTPTSRLCEIVMSNSDSDAISMRYMCDRDGGNHPGACLRILETDCEDVGLNHEHGSINRAKTYPRVRYLVEDAFGANLNDTRMVEGILSTLRVAWPNALEPLQILATPSEHTEDPHEAHGVWVIIKALAQQNASAVMLLKTIVCIGASLSYARSLLVEGFLSDFRCREGRQIIRLMTMDAEKEVAEL